MFVKKGYVAVILNTFYLYANCMFLSGIFTRTSSRDTMWRTMTKITNAKRSPSRYNALRTFKADILFSNGIVNANIN